jgi:hypothetical protein
MQSKKMPSSEDIFSSAPRKGKDLTYDEVLALEAT